VELVQTNEIHNFHQGMLSASGIYLLDFESEAFVWIGKLAPKHRQAVALQLATEALELVSIKGHSRAENMTINLVYYGFEPDIFK